MRFTGSEMEIQSAARANCSKTYRTDRPTSAVKTVFTARYELILYIQGGSNMTGTDAACLHTNQSRSYLNHPVYTG